MLLAFLVLCIIQPRLLTAPTKQEHGWGVALGLLTFVGLFLQFWGMADCTPALSAFLTCLGSAWVPILAWLLFRVLVARSTLMGLLLGVIGVAILTLKPQEQWRMSQGEMLTLASSFLFAGQILFVDRIGNRVKSAHLTISMFGTTAILSLGLACILSAQEQGIDVWLRWVIGMLSQSGILTALLALVLFSTVLGFHWMNTYQPLVPAGRAALLYLLEPVWAAVIAIPWGLESLSWRLAVGGAFILMGNYLVEVWSRKPEPRLLAPE